MAADFITLLVSLFVIINPFASMPVLINFFKDPKQQRKAALEASVAAFLILVIFSLFGIWVLTAMGISIPAFMIAGGLLLLVLGFDFILGQNMPRSRHVVKDAAEVIVPIGTPLLAGPGAITTVIYFSSTYGLFATLPAIIIAMLISFLFLYATSAFSKHLGRNGLRILSRIMGLLTAAIAISLIEKALVIYGIIRM